MFRYFYLGQRTLFKILCSIFIHFLKGLIIVITIIPRYFIIGIKYSFNKKKKDEIKIKDKSIIPILILGLSLTIYFISIFIISRWYVQKLKLEFLTNDIIESTTIIEEKEQQLKEENGEEEVRNTEENYYPSYTPLDASYININFNDLLNTNSDTVGWIKIDNTKVNYPIVQSSDNEYYLNHNFYKDNNSNGWVFGDYRDNFNSFSYNTIIYGHNLLDRSMFGSLAWTLKESWYTNNKYIKISTPTSNTVWEIFSIYTVEPEVFYLKTYFTTDLEYEDFLITIKNRSIYDFGLTPTRNDKTLTLSTCDDAGLKRLVIHATMKSISYK